MILLGCRRALLYSLVVHTALALATSSPHAQGSLRLLLQATNTSTSPTSSAASNMDYIVTIDDDNDFVAGCEKFYFTGWNQWEAVESGAGAPRLFGSVLPTNVTAPQMLRELMSSASAAGLTVMRTWAHAVSSQYAMQTSPEVYNDALLHGLDFVLETARQSGIRLLLSLTTNWGDTGSVDQYVSWSPTASQHSDFFSDAACMQMYRNFARTIITRVNSINGRRYSDDPTIFGWNLINEPRCYNCADQLQEWITTMASYIKTLDSKHLLSIGEEGFYSQGAGANNGNPQGTWARQQGQDYVANCGIQDIDFCTFHSWVDNWLDDDVVFQRSWIARHGTDASQIGKPAVLEEFGKWVKAGTSATLAERNQFYQAIYEEVENSATSGGAIKGSALWLLLSPGQTGPLADGGEGGLFGIYQGDSTFEYVASNAQVMGGLRKSTACASEPVAAAPVNDCRDTWVNGRPGTGYQGPSCDLNINECVRGTAKCSINSGCIDTDGGFRCVCFWGYADDGSGACKPTQQLQGLNMRYTTHGPGTIACQEGRDVAYPPGAPGYQDDPTGHFNTTSAGKGGFGSLVPVSIFGCQLACEAAEGCDSFAYNDVLEACFLKSGVGNSVCRASTASCTETNQQLETVTFSCGSWQTFYRTAGPSQAQSPASTPVTALAG